MDTLVTQDTLLSPANNPGDYSQENSPESIQDALCEVSPGIKGSGTTVNSKGGYKWSKDPNLLGRNRINQENASLVLLTLLVLRYSRNPEIDSHGIVNFVFMLSRRLNLKCGFHFCYYGVYSETLDRAIQVMLCRGLITQVLEPHHHKNKYVLTPEGKSFLSAYRPSTIQIKEAKALGNYVPLRGAPHSYDRFSIVLISAIECLKAMTRKNKVDIDLLRQVQFFGFPASAARIKDLEKFIGIKDDRRSARHIAPKGWWERLRKYRTSYARYKHRGAPNYWGVRSSRRRGWGR